MVEVRVHLSILDTSNISEVSLETFDFLLVHIVLMLFRVVHFSVCIYDAWFPYAFTVSFGNF